MDSLERLLKDWNELAASTHDALEAAGNEGVRWGDWPYDALSIGLVAEIVGGTADPKAGHFSQVIAPNGKLIQVQQVTADGTGLIAQWFPVSMVQRMCDEVAVVVTADLRPVAVHFLDVQFLEPLAHALGLIENGPGFSEASVAFGRLMHIAIATEPTVAAAWGTRTTWLSEHLAEETSVRVLAQRLRRQYNRACDLSERTKRVVDHVTLLERNGLFQWTELDVPYNNMGATLTDALLAFLGHYEPFTATRVGSVLEEYPELVTTSDLLAVLEEDDRFWSVTEWPDNERAHVMRQIALLFKTLDLETEGDLVTSRGGQTVAGLEMLSPRERSYLLLMAGSKERSSASHPIRRFIKDSGVEDAFMLDDVAIEVTMIEAASALGRSASTLDHSVWRTSRAQLELF